MDPKPPSGDQVATESNELDLLQLVNSLPEDKLRELGNVLAVRHVETTFSGPLPTPKDFEKYNQVLPNAADRILAMAEKEQQIRADVETGMLVNDRRRINAATGLGAGLIAVAALATWQDQISIAIPLGLAGTITTILRYVADRLSRRRDPKED